VALQLPITTLRHILHKDSGFHLYKVQLVQVLSDRNGEDLQRFCEQFRELLSDDDLQDNLIMTDEAHFHLSGYINKQNVRYWAPDNPVKCLSVRITLPMLLCGVAF
jgi:hypothetical protein